MEDAKAGRMRRTGVTPRMDLALLSHFEIVFVVIVL